MKQLIQSYKTGKLEVAEAPMPNCGSNMILVRNENSLVSIGTERSIIELGKASLLGKAKARPDLVKKALDKAKKEGFVKTFQEALGRLDNPTELGYSSTGIVEAVGSGINTFSPGDRVACIGAGYASHAEYITVPENLCCKIPDNVSFEEASFGMLGIIALHGIRTANLTFGESVTVIGLGLLGFITVQLCKAYGCKVIGMDISAEKIKLAQNYGIDAVYSNDIELKNGVERLTNGYGSDAVIITVATKSDVPVHTAVDISRAGGRVIVVGVADIHPNRNEMWHKEVQVIVSKAGGPGSLDPIYENKGIDYPLGFVRWTQKRNLEEFIRLISDKKIDVAGMVSHRIAIENAVGIYQDIIDGNGGPYLGVLLEYKNKKDTSRTILINKEATLVDGNVSFGVIGAGLFGKALLIPTLAKIKGAFLHTLSTSSGSNGFYTARKFKFKQTTTDYKSVLADNEVNAVVILTPHKLHSKMVIDSLKAGKNVFVEKPLCISESELQEITNTYEALISSPFQGEVPGLSGEALAKTEGRRGVPTLMVGYNRRFSSHTEKVLSVIKNRKDPLVITYRVNAGFVPGEHWVHDEEEGGGRVLGEMVHFIDLMQTITGSDIVNVFANRVSGNNKTIINSDNMSCVLKFKDGSIGNLVYSASGDKSFSREIFEVFSEGISVQCKDFKNTVIYNKGKVEKFNTFNQQMGYKEELAYFVSLIKGQAKVSLTFNDIYNSTLTALKINESLETGLAVSL